MKLDFNVIEAGGAIGMRLFTLDDILPNFTTKRKGHKIEKIYGYNTINHDVFDQELDLYSGLKAIKNIISMRMDKRF